MLGILFDYWGLGLGFFIILQKGFLCLHWGIWTKGESGQLEASDSWRDLSEEDCQVAVIAVERHLLGLGHVPAQIRGCMEVLATQLARNQRTYPKEASLVQAGRFKIPSQVALLGD